MAVIISPETSDALRPDVTQEIPSSVLFICNFNAVRSPMAEALTKYYCGHKIYVESAGIRAEDDGPNPFTVAVMDEIGLDIAEHIPKNLDEVMDASFDLVVTLSPEAQHKAIDYTRTLDCRVEYWPTIDPTAVTGNRENILTAYRQTRDMLTEKIKQRFDVHYFPKV